jgi:hypothetical protein
MAGPGPEPVDRVESDRAFMSFVEEINSQPDRVDFGQVIFSLNAGHTQYDTLGEIEHLFNQEISIDEEEVIKIPVNLHRVLLGPRVKHVWRIRRNRQEKRCLQMKASHICAPTVTVGRPRPFTGSLANTTDVSYCDRKDRCHRVGNDEKRTAMRATHTCNKLHEDRQTDRLLH